VTLTAIASTKVRNLGNTSNNPNFVLKQLMRMSAVALINYIGTSTARRRWEDNIKMDLPGSGM
jgi:hypothetical protein